MKILRECLEQAVEAGAVAELKRIHEDEKASRLQVPEAFCERLRTFGIRQVLKQVLCQQSGMAGQKVTVWGETRSPRKQYVDYLTDVLNKIGFKATEKIINDQVYFQTVGNQKTKPQIGFADWVQDFPNPWDFMQLMTTAAIQPQNSSNYGYVSDKHIDQMVDKLAQVPANNVQSVASQWAALDDYAVKQGYYAAYGHEKFPKFYSNRLNFSAGVFSIQYQTDMTSLQLSSGS